MTTVSATPNPYDILRWYLEAGVDESMGEEPVDRYATSRRAVESRAAAAAPAVAPPRHSPRQAEPMAAPTGASLSASALPGTAAHLAASCADLQALRHAMEGFEGLPLKQAASSTVFGDGNPEASVMCIGEAPGQEEDRRGLPFVGPSGKLLDRMLASIGLDRTSCYITNVVPWRPPANRKPTPDEVAVCMPFLTRHIELVDPQVLILLGGAAAAAVLAKADGINRLRGQWFEFNSPGLPRPIPALATFHPAYLLRTPDAKRDAWRDLLMIAKKLASARH
ncbi:Uracil-DNA glycosylase family 4 [Paramagnetospirillum magnetotacticum MS-1]|uniref:Type-4 uracil-DNA glycosylase n=1 Tax=Paramagnetospirillum magnetotacticum MS-1 TaxID=272627 RepID=A0A0C2U7H8_PARME|nr:uracil-DNA glycosylase [Paramagnetospirillum magnetotacticum]KIL97427.1 Uracil-DNA glycosylase family 4 [Paramagnetospirillum magnetotacticum MS-1]